jgi:serine/threonine protein kinase
MPLPSIDAFLDLVNKSGVVEPVRLDTYVDKLRAARTLPPDAAKLAGLLVRDAVLTQFQAQQLLAGKWKGFFIGKYKVLEKLGSGGMGTVYLAEHKFMKRRVAIKVLPKSKALEPSSLERFYREAKAIAALDHPNIVRAYDIDQDKLPDGTELHFLVMEYVDGSSLQDIVRVKGALDCARAAHYIYQAAQGLQHAHAMGLVHRDIKPGNLLVDRSGTVKILDMGLARFFNDDQDVLTKKYDENVLGTADYLAPEQALDSHSVDIRADIYSLGGTFYFLLTSRSPFGEGTVAQKLIWHQTRRPKPVRDLRGDVPEELVVVLEKMMHKAPAERFQVPSDLVQALANWAQCDNAAPAESEMPALSPAARATPSSSSGDTAEDNGAVSPTAPTALRKASSTVTSAAGGPAPATVAVPPPRLPSGGTARPSGPANGSPVGQRRTPLPPPDGPDLLAPDSPAPKSKGEPHEGSKPGRSGDNFSWTAVTDTGEPFAMTEETLKSGSRASARPSRRPVRLQLPFTLSPRLLIVIGALVGGALLVATVLLIAMYGMQRPTKLPVPNPTAPTGPVKTIVYVSKSKVGFEDLATIKEALEKAEPGDHIVVRDRETYDEALVLTPASGLGKRDVVLEAEADSEGNTAVLRATTAEPLVTLERVDGFTLKGFTLDGNQVCEDLVRVSGACPGAKFQNLRLRGYNRAGIRLDGCEGVKGREVSFRHLRIESTRDKALPAASAIAFGPPTKGAAAPSRYVHFTECRLEGPYEATVRLGTALLAVSFDRNLFVANKGTGFLLPTDGVAGPSIRMAITNNTFWDCQFGLVLQQRPRLDTDLRFSSNLFYQVGAGPSQGIGMAQNESSPEYLEGYIKGEGNVHDPKSQPGNLRAVPTLQLKSMTFTLPTKNRDAEDFLRYPADSPLATAGERGAPVGALTPQP